MFTPGERYDISDLKRSMIEGEPIYSFRKKADLSEHLSMLEAEFRGRTRLELFHAATIVFIRRGLEVDQSKENFRDLWENECDFLVERLDSRWLISACDTIVDVSNDEPQRAAAAAATLFVNTCKLYETERLATTPHGALDSDLTSGRLPLWDGLSAYRIGHGDMIKNLLRRIDTLAPDKPAIRILKELVRRTTTSDTVFKRFRDVHVATRTEW